MLCYGMLIIGRYELNDMNINIDKQTDRCDMGFLK